MSVYEKMTALADAIREKTGGTEKLSIDQMTAEVKAFQAGGGSTEEEWFNDGNTHLWIHLEEGRTSPVLGIGVNGTVTVDWGDGTTPTVLTGTSLSTAKYTSAHNYAAAGDYVITLKVNGTACIIGKYNYGTQLLVNSATTSDKKSRFYHNAFRKLEVGEGVTAISNYAFENCYALTSITISESVTTIGSYAFQGCRALTSITIPESVTAIGESAFQGCHALTSITIPDGVTAISNSTFNSCYALTSVVIPKSVTTIGESAFQSCYALTSVVIPDGVTDIGNNAFQNCSSLTPVVIPKSVTTIGTYAFQRCYVLTSVVIPDGVTAISNSTFNSCETLVSVVIPGSVTTIGTYAFNCCYCLRYCDFTNHTAVPTLSNTNAFDIIASDCEIRVPSALYDEWIAATNWATHASKIVAV